METIEMRCTTCRNGCLLEVEVEDGELYDVTGNGCMRGMAYAQRRLSHPEEEVNMHRK